MNPTDRTHFRMLTPRAPAIRPFRWPPLMGTKLRIQWSDQIESPFSNSTFFDLWQCLGSPITRSRTSNVIAIDSGLYLKRYEYPKFRDRIRAPFRYTFIGWSRAEREWTHLDRLLRLELNATIPHGFGEERHCGWLRRCWLLTESRPGAIPLSAVSAPLSHESLRNLGVYVGRLHEAGFIHGGLFARNIIVDETQSGDMGFSIIDPPKGRWLGVNAKGGDHAKLDLRAWIGDLRAMNYDRSSVETAYEGYIGMTDKDPQGSASTLDDLFKMSVEGRRVRRYPPST